MSDQLTAEPGTLEFLRELLEISQGSDHPIDKELTKVLSKQMGEMEAKNAQQVGCFACDDREEIPIRCGVCGGVTIYVRGARYGA